MTIDALWYTRCNSAPSASAIALATGDLEKEFAADGIVVAPLQESSLPMSMEAHFDHGHDNLFREGGNIPPLWACSVDSSVRIVAVHPANHSQVLLARPGSGIASLQDLRGARFGLPRHRHEKIDFWAAVGLRVLQTALSQAGLPDDAVEVVELDARSKWFGPAGSGDDLSARFAPLGRMGFQRTELSAWVSGEVDVIASTDFRAAEIASMFGATVLVDVGRSADGVGRTSNLNPVVLTASAQLCREAPGIVARYLTSAMRAAHWAASHSEAVVGMMAAANHTSTTAISLGYARDFHEQLTPTLDAELLAGLASQKEFLLSRGFLDHEFRLEDFIDPQPLELARKMHSSG